MKFYCPICKEELIEKKEEVKCSFCGTREESDWICPNGHYHCEECRLSDSKEIIQRVCLNNKSTNSIEIANLLMHHSSFHNYGVEHHLIVAPAILTALFNLGKITNLKEKITTAIKRLEDMPMGVCGTRGDCGASVGAGVALAILLKATYKSDKERQIVLETTGRALIDLGKRGGKRCCKESVYSAIETAYFVLKEHNIAILPEPRVKCVFKGIDECKKEICVYYRI